MKLDSITDSKVAKAAGYDPDRKVMQVVFKNGLYYEYGSVEPEQFAQFQSAESKGGWIAANLSGKNAKQHQFTKIPPPEEQQ